MSISDPGARRAGGRDTAASSGDILFPVPPRRGTVARRAVVLAPLLLAGAAGAAYLKQADPSLHLEVTAPPPSMRPAVAPPLDTIDDSVADSGADSKAGAAAPRNRRTPEARHAPPPPPARPAAPRIHRARPPAPKAVTPPAVIPPPAPLPRAPGTLSISANPWGSVSIDGVDVGASPIVALPLAAGTHRVRVARPGFVAFDSVIDVAPGGVVRLTSITLKHQ